MARRQRSTASGMERPHQRPGPCGMKYPCALPDGAKRTINRAECLTSIASPRTSSGENARRGPIRAVQMASRQSLLLTAGLDLVRAVASTAVVQVQWLLVEEGLAILERDLTGRVLRLRRYDLRLDARGLSRGLHFALHAHTRGEVGALSSVRAAAPGPRRRGLCEGHHWDEQREHRQYRYDYRPPHVTLHRLGFTALALQ